MIMTAEEAFLELINNKTYLSSLPYDERKAIASYKSQYKRGTLIARNINTLLEKHKYHLVQEAQWDINKIEK